MAKFGRCSRQRTKKQAGLKIGKKYDLRPKSRYMPISQKLIKRNTEEKCSFTYYIRLHRRRPNSPGKDHSALRTRCSPGCRRTGIPCPGIDVMLCTSHQQAQGKGKRSHTHVGVSAACTSLFRSPLHQPVRYVIYVGWLRGIVVERLSVAGELSRSYARLQLMGDHLCG